MDASYQTPNLAQPDQGSLAVPYVLDFTSAAILTVDLTQAVLQDKINFIQSVFVDNADNSTSLDLTFMGGPSPNYRVRVQANQQGWFPIAWPIGATRLIASSNAGSKINVQFANFAMPYFTWGPVPGVSVVPPLVNNALAPLNFAGAGSAQLVAGVATETVKLYRGMFNVDNLVVLLFQDGNGGPTLFSADLTAGGALTFQVSGVPWFNTSAGNGLYLHASGACNVYGGYGYVQS